MTLHIVEYTKYKVTEMFRWIIGLNQLSTKWRVYLVPNLEIIHWNGSSEISMRLIQTPPKSDNFQSAIAPKPGGFGNPGRESEPA